MQGANDGRERERDEGDEAGSRGVVKLDLSGNSAWRMLNISSSRSKSQL